MSNLTELTLPEPEVSRDVSSLPGAPNRDTSAVQPRHGESKISNALLEKLDPFPTRHTIFVKQKSSKKVRKVRKLPKRSNHSDKNRKRRDDRTSPNQGIGLENSNHGRQGPLSHATEVSKSSKSSSVFEDAVVSPMPTIYAPSFPATSNLKRATKQGSDTYRAANLELIARQPSNTSRSMNSAMDSRLTRGQPNMRPRPSHLPSMTERKDSRQGVHGFERVQIRSKKSRKGVVRHSPPRGLERRPVQISAGNDRLRQIKSENSRPGGRMTNRSNDYANPFASNLRDVESAFSGRAQVYRPRLPSKGGKEPPIQRTKAIEKVYTRADWLNYEKHEVIAKKRAYQQPFLVIQNWFLKSLRNFLRTFVAEDHPEDGTQFMDIDDQVEQLKARFFERYESDGSTVFLSHRITVSRSVLKWILTNVFGARPSNHLSLEILCQLLDSSSSMEVDLEDVPVVAFFFLRNSDSESTFYRCASLLFKLFSLGHGETLTKNDFNQMVYCIAKRDLDVFTKKIPFGSKCFTSFLTKESSEEGMLFFLDLEELKRKSEVHGSSFIPIEDAVAIIDTYLTPSSPKQINISFTARVQAENEIKDAINRGRISVHYKIFDAAIHEVFDMLASDKYPRFCEMIAHCEDKFNQYSEEDTIAAVTWEANNIDQSSSMKFKTFSSWCEQVPFVMNQFRDIYRMLKPLAPPGFLDR